MPHLTQRQIKVLKVISGDRPVVAPWNHADLTALQDARLVERRVALQASGKLSSNVIWTITGAGLLFLEEERGGC